MPNQLLEQFRRVVLSLTIRQRTVVAIAAIVAVAFFAFLLNWNKESGFKTLFTNVSGEEAGQILTKLKESNVEFRLADGGTTIKVPAAKLDELRINMASVGLPKTGRIGYELFDRNNFGSSEFAEQVNYHRAVEGELERSIMSISEVETARVHITFPKQSIFLENRQPAKASVLLKVKPGSRLITTNVVAIMRLTANAVEGLNPDDVAVLDMRGALLNPARRTDADSASNSEALLDYRQKVESAIQTKINQTLEPILGLDHFRTGISVECDFTSGEQSEETFDPSKSVMSTSQKTEDVGALAAAAGVPGTPSNLPRPIARAGSGSGGQQRKTESINYQTSRLVRHLKLPQGMVKRVSASVLVDHNVRFEGVGDKAKKIVEPPTPERLKAIKDVVAAAIGFTADRGDQLIVEAIPFEATQATQGPAPIKTDGQKQKIALPNWVPGWLKPQLEEQLNDLVQWKYFTATIILFALFVVAIPLLILRAIGRKVGGMVSRKKAIAGSESVGQKQIPVPAGQTAAPGQALPPGAQAISLNPEQALKEYESSLSEADRLHRKLTEDAVSQLKKPAATTQRGEVLAKHLSEETKKNPQGMAQLIRTWLAEK